MRKYERLRNFEFTLILDHILLKANCFKKFNQDAELY